MVFCTLTAYGLQSQQRLNAEAFLKRLTRQLEDDDELLRVDAYWQSRNRAWALKPKVVLAALEYTQDWVCWVDADTWFNEGFVRELKKFLSPYDPSNSWLFASTVPYESVLHTPQYWDTMTYSTPPWWKTLLEECGVPTKGIEVIYSTALMVFSKGAKEFVKVWCEEQEKLSHTLEKDEPPPINEISLCAALHKEPKPTINHNFLPVTLHMLDMEGKNVFISLAVSISSNVFPSLWTQLAELAERGE